ncbi:YfcC family protein [Idiomarina xiamenensis]|uniref:C4-dicarboxylate anaerobic carrier-like protein n=1 Tax=Idiomarina xiamenensis 10-D-4 TaxID=740709 RepID=K2K657_9GAMM|nr:AbgT family transporter [Idiomarina xiamenensis]EKE82082.1 C4-dicarboxylate anaerobic carrier-like protein [Idiomarina xiamenensis 10-D-4]
MKQTFRIRVPHTLILMFAMIVMALILTWVIPAGEYQRSINAAGQQVVVPGTYQTLDNVDKLPPWSVLTVIPRALAEAQAVIFFVFLIGGVLGIIRKTGTLDAAIGALLRTFAGRINGLIFGGMFVFGVFSSLIGMAAEYVVFVGLLVALCRALKLDAIVAMGILVVGYGVGYGLSVVNPFTVLIAQSIAEVPPTSGMWYRLLLLVPVFAVGFHHVWRYARKVQADPSQSLMPANADDSEPQSQFPALTWTHKLVLLAFAATLAILVYGIKVYDWYLVELSALFLGLGIVTAVIARMAGDDIGNSFIEGAAQLTATALLVGFARGIALLLEDGQVLHTIIFYLATPLQHVGAEVAAVGMLLIQSTLNFFIPSGSGQAFATMPIMVPIGDLVGVSRQVSVLAFQMGDGFMNMIVPTNPVLMGILGIAGIPYGKWFRFIAPLMLKLLVVCALALIVAVLIGY